MFNNGPKCSSGPTVQVVVSDRWCVFLLLLAGHGKWPRLRRLQRRRTSRTRRANDGYVRDGVLRDSGVRRPGQMAVGAVSGNSARRRRYDGGRRFGRENGERRRRAAAVVPLVRRAVRDGSRAVCRAADCRRRRRERERE